MKLDGVIAIVPVFNPEPGLKQLCEKLVEAFGMVLVVDDGSDENVEDFSHLSDGVKVVHHGINQGKGRAIKTGIEWVKKNCPGTRAVVFADGDGQHRPVDVQRVAEMALKTNRVTLGVRDFSKSGIPFRSRFGNVLTSFFVRLMYRWPIYDTQTGLRAIPVRLLDAMLLIQGERYEYEMRLFSELRKLHEGIELVPIETIYIENNRASHFHPIKDSFRVYTGLFGGKFLKFCMSSLLGFAVDNSIFTLALLSFESLGVSRSFAISSSFGIARFFSVGVNFVCNYKLVFRSSQSVFVPMVRYLVLAFVILCVSSCFTSIMSTFLDVHGALVTCVKIFVDCMVFVVSYSCQKRWVFK